MNGAKKRKPKPVTRETAQIYAQWFEALSDPSRILILNELARAGRAMTVGELVDSLDVGQSTVSHHLARLAKARFVLMERSGTTTLVAINERCLTQFPSAATAVLGLQAPRATGRSQC
jgi:DNA-binding transcriptional ArsR family regulator